MADVWEEIERAVEAGDAERVADLCLPLDEDERERLADRGQALLERLSEGTWMNPVPRAAQTARFGLGPPLPSSGYDPFEPPPGRLEALVRSRPRPWRDAWAEWAVRRGHQDRVATWHTLRSLVRDGQCETPANGRYGVLLVVALRDLEQSWSALRRDPPAHDWMARYARADPPPYEDAVSMLRDDPDVLAGVVWWPFRFPRYDGWDAWERALVALAAKGAVPRDRLIDETLAAIGRDPDPATTKRWIAFHDRLVKPSADELAARQAVYLRWLESDRDALVGFALASVLRLDRSVPVDGRTLLERLGGAVAIRAKTHAKRAVTLVGRVMDREPLLADDCAEVLAEGLGHPAAEVQEAVVETVERHAEAFPRERLADLAAVADPAVRARLERLSGPAAEGPAAVAVAVPRPSVVGPRLVPSSAITPVADVEELLELASLLLEGLDDPDEYERFVDGISRLCDAPVSKGRRTALVRRADRRRNHVAAYAERLVLSWLAPDPERPGSLGWNGPTEALGRRLTALMRRVARAQPDVLLSAPTHRGGFLDPEVLCERLERAREVEDHDLAQALLRLPRLGLERVASIGGEAGAVARGALTGEGPAGTVALPASWDTARVLADPAAIEIVPAADPNQGFGGYRPGASVSPARKLAEGETVWDAPAAAGTPVQRWLALVWPGRRELFYDAVRHAAWWMQSDWRKAFPADRVGAALATMAYPDETLGPNALGILAPALGAEGELRLRATDVVIDAIATRRLDPVALGRALTVVDRWQAAKPSRLAAALEPVATCGALHAHELQLALEAMLGALGDQRPQIIGLVDLLRRLAQDADAAVTDPAARAWLESTSRSSKTGRLARAALDVRGDGAARSIEAAAAAKEADRERALRWSAA